MKTKYLWLMMISVFLFSGFMCAYAEEDGVTKGGVKFNMAQDRQMETVGGIYSPEGLDKYIKRLTDDLSNKIMDLSRRLDGIEKQLTEIHQSVASRPSLEPARKNDNVLNS